MGLAWTGAGSPASLTDIAAAAAAAGAPLPPELVGFYLSHNGGCPGDHAPLPGPVHGYLQLGSAETAAGGRAAEMAEENPVLRGLYPFAYDAGGNTFWVSLRAADRGTTFVHLHQTDDLEPLELTLAELLPTEALGWGLRPARAGAPADAHPQLAALYQLGDGLLTRGGISVYPGHDLAERNETYEIAEYASGFQLFGDDSGARGFLLRLSAPDSPVYSSGLGDLAPESFTVVGADLGTWLKSLR